MITIGKRSPGSYTMPMQLMAKYPQAKNLLAAKKGQTAANAAAAAVAHPVFDQQKTAALRSNACQMPVPNGGGAMGGGHYAPMQAAGINYMAPTAAAGGYYPPQLPTNTYHVVPMPYRVVFAANGAGQMVPTVLPIDRMMPMSVNPILYPPPNQSSAQQPDLKMPHPQHAVRADNSPLPPDRKTWIQPFGCQTPPSPIALPSGGAMAGDDNKSYSSRYGF